MEGKVEPVVAHLEAESLEEWAARLRDAQRQDQGTGASPADFDPFRPVSAQSDEDAASSADSDEMIEEAIAVVRRGVRVQPFAESTPLVPLYDAQEDLSLPPDLLVQHRDQRYDFVHVELTFSVLLEDDEVAEAAEFEVEIDDGLQGPRATRAIQVFPEAVHKPWFKAGGQLSVGLDASLRFAVSAKADAAGGNAEGSAASKMSVLLGPFEVSFGSTELDVVGGGGREVGWRYLTRDSLTGRRDFKSYLVLKVARETPKVALRAKIGVRSRKRHWWAKFLRAALPVLRAEAEIGVELPPREASAPNQAG